jgi:hypothetical protein
MALLPEMDQAIVRHMAERTDYVYKAFEINMSIDFLTTKSPNLCF